MGSHAPAQHATARAYDNDDDDAALPELLSNSGDEPPAQMMLDSDSGEEPALDETGQAMQAPMSCGSSVVGQGELAAGIVGVLHEMHGKGPIDYMFARHCVAALPAPRRRADVCQQCNQTDMHQRWLVALSQNEKLMRALVPAGGKMQRDGFVPLGP